MTRLIPFEDFSGQGPTLHFAHANGYPPACYRLLLTHLADDFRVLALHQRPLWPDSRPDEVDSWHVIADDLVRFLDQQSLTGTIGVGHSIGAVVTMMAAVKRPDLFRSLILIEPVFLLPSVLQMIDQNPEAGDDFPLVRITKSRSRSWPDRQSAFNHFRPKRVFARWSDDTLWDYVRHGMHLNEAGRVELTYSPEWEARIYMLPPTDVWELIPQNQIPTLAIRGAESDTLAPAAWYLWQANQPQATFEEFGSTGHLLPMEQPAAVAAAIRSFVYRPG